MRIPHIRYYRFYQKKIDNLCDYINATIGFEELGRATDRSPKSLMRMFSPSGNPTANNLFGIIHVLQKKEGLRLEVRDS